MPGTTTIPDLPAASAVNATDLLVKENDPSGTPQTQKATIIQLVTALKLIIKLDELAAPTDVTTLNATTSAHGLLKKLSNVATEFLDGTGAFDSVKDSDLSTSDITTNDVSTSKHGFVPKAPNSALKFLNGTGAWSFANWDTQIIKSADQDVTNNATPQADSELLFAVVTGGHYLVDFFLRYAGNDTTGDYRGRFSANVSTTMMGHYHYLNASFVSTFTSQNTAAPFPNTDMICGADSLSAVRNAYMRFILISAANENVVWQFANSAAAGGRTSRTSAGSLLLVRRLV